jgi:hypothetical protein
MKKRTVDGIKQLNLGDLVLVEWCDASTGKSLSSGSNIDIPVESWGIYLAVLGAKAKHIILAQNNYRIADGLYDLDYTAIPLQWSESVRVLAKNHVRLKEAQDMLNSFLTGRRGTLGQKKQQQRMVNHHA